MHDTPEQLQLYMDVVYEVFTEYGLVIAGDKTKLLSWGGIQQTCFKIGTEVIEWVEKFKYLGHYVSPSEQEYFLDRQIGAAYGAFAKHKQVFQNRSIFMSARTTLLSSLVRSRLTYAVQSWQLTERQISRLSAVWHKMLRSMVQGGFSRKNPNDPNDFSMKISNSRLLSITKTQSLRDFIKRQQLQYAGHVVRMSNNTQCTQRGKNPDETPQNPIWEFFEDC